MSADLYETDFYAWAEEQAASLRALASSRTNTPRPVDWDNLIEEVADLARAQVRELEAHYFRLLTHLLKWQFQPEARSSGWTGTINEQRYRIGRILKENPSLRPRREAVMLEAYEGAIAQAAAETGLTRSVFPASCPYILGQVEADDFFPDAADGG
jgi:hypothetical protein